jgi:hypothetical protein
MQWLTPELLQRSLSNEEARLALLPAGQVREDMPIRGT